MYMLPELGLKTVTSSIRKASQIEEQKATTVFDAMKDGELGFWNKNFGSFASVSETTVMAHNNPESQFYWVNFNLMSILFDLKKLCALYVFNTQQYSKHHIFEKEAKN